MAWRPAPLFSSLWRLLSPGPQSPEVAKGHDVPRWLLLGLLLAAALGLFTYLGDRRATIPESCQTAGAALDAQDYDLAIDQYLLCLDDESLPEEVISQVFVRLGIAYAAKDNHYQAIRDYSDAIRLNPNHPWAYNNRCWSYGQLRQAEEALEDCNRALQLLPDQPEILDSRALAFWLLGDQDKARADLERARRIDSSVPTWQTRFQEFEEMF